MVCPEHQCIQAAPNFSLAETPSGKAVANDLAQNFDH
jgi:hypothetical protein